MPNYQRLKHPFIESVIYCKAACTFLIQTLSLYHQVICVNTFSVVQDKLDSDWLF